MSKIGRNDPCPCGSGKKYKKCCMGKIDEDILLGKNEIMENTKRFFDDFWNYDMVNEMETEEILEILKEIGIDFDKESFIKTADKTITGEAIANSWYNNFNVTAEGADEDFPIIAAMVLWERLVPYPNLSADQMDDMIEKAYIYSSENKSLETCDICFKVWDGIKYRIKPEYRNIKPLDEMYKSWFYVSNFCQELESDLHNAGLIDNTYFDKRINYCREFLEYFPDEKELITHNMRRAICESYAYLKDYKTAESECKKLVDDYPDNMWSYIEWGDLYLYEQKKDFDKAVELYQKAISVSKDDEELDIVNERLDDAKERIQRDCLC